MERLRPWVYPVAVLVAAAPLWATELLPMVDLPQHLHLISALRRLDDPTTLYPQLFERRGEFTPYLGYYHLVGLLGWLLPLELANRLFLSACVIALPLSVAFLLEALERPTWPSLLAIPFAYGDAFGWGFLNYLSSIPLALLACGAFVRAITAPAAGARMRWSWTCGALVLLVLAFHVQTFAFLGLALPLLLLTTAAPEDAAGGVRLRARLPVVAAMLPAVTLFLGWVALRASRPSPIAPGEPWKAWGPALSPQNLSVKPPGQNLEELFSLGGNLLRGGADAWPMRAALAVGAVACLLALFAHLRGEPRVRGVGRWRGLLLGGAALVLFFALPFDVRGYIYYLNTRYLHLVWPLLLAALPTLRTDVRDRLMLAAALVPVATAAVLGHGFARFDDEARALVALRADVAARPMVMGLIHAAGSRHLNHPVYLHSAAELARAGGGAANFSFASTPHSPLRFRGAPPPTFPSEWRPQELDLQRHGQAYDHFLIRGAHPAQVFGERLGAQYEIAARRGDFWLVQRR